MSFRNKQFWRAYFKSSLGCMAAIAGTVLNKVARLSDRASIKLMEYSISTLQDSKNILDDIKGAEVLSDEH